MALEPLPALAAWQHQGLRTGFEVARFGRSDLDGVGSAGAGGVRIAGTSTGLQDDQAWAVTYQVEVDQAWRTRSARVAVLGPAGWLELVVESDGQGDWWVNGVPAPGLAGCVDVDLEASAVTNTLPIHRLGLGPGQSAEVPAAYVALDGSNVERLDQTYHRAVDPPVDLSGGLAFDYRAPAFEFEARLAFDRSGLVLDYPGLARRAR